MTQNRIVLAGTGSGSGKTTLTIGLMAALKRKGYRVQGFKCGPDYIDPTYHTAVTGRASRNLDSWMLTEDTVKEIFHKGSIGADISIIEGVMGFYDGKEATSNKGSTAEISILLESPVVLVVNCQSMARSAAAVVKGFLLLSGETKIAGVIANKVGSEGHYRMVKAAIEQECGIPVLGYLKREAEVEIPERHLGLVPSIERGELEPLFQRLADLVSATIDLNEIVNIAGNAPHVETEPCLFKTAGTEQQVTIAVAKDPAFHFYYPENLELLESYGAKCVYFSPLAGEMVPEEADGLYIGGGFPEEFAAELASNEDVLHSFRTRIERGLPTLAECGGFMFLTEELITTNQEAYRMVGIIPGKVSMQKRFAALGYREITGVEGNFLLGQGEQAKGHEFHYSTFATDQEPVYAFQTKGLRGTKPEGVVLRNLIAGYTHLHFASNPEMVKRWIDKCLEVKAHG